MTEPKWLTLAYTKIGITEFPGKAHNPAILSMWQRLGIAIRDDETPWCAAATGAILEEAGHVSTRSAAARSYLKWGHRLHGPCLGCVVVFWRGSINGWSGHVGFLVGYNSNGDLLILGGNQGDAVSIRPYKMERVLGYRWPLGEPIKNEWWHVPTLGY